MVTVCMLLSGDQPVGFEATGHADFADPGSDIVCSAVSALTQTTLMGLKEIVKAPAGFSMEDGNLYCILGDDSSEEQLQEAKLLLNVMRLGLESIAQTYREHLIITEREV